MSRKLKISISGLLIIKASSVSRSAFGSIAISAVLGLSSVAIYNNYYYVQNAVTAMLIVLTSSIAAPIGNSIASESKEKNLADMNKFNFIYMWLVGWCTACLLCLYQPFMKIWVGPDLMISDEVMLLFPIMFVVAKLGEVKAQYVDATGIWWYRKWYSLAEAVTNIGLCFLLGHFFGIAGVLIAAISSQFICDFLISSHVIFKHYFGFGCLKYQLSQFAYLAVTFFISALTFFVCRLLSGYLTSDWLTLISYGCVCLIVPNLLFFLCYFWTPIFKVSKNWVFQQMSGLGKRKKND